VCVGGSDQAADQRAIGSGGGRDVGFAGDLRIGVDDDAAGSSDRSHGSGSDEGATRHW
jgi:hypothetical protein